MSPPKKARAKGANLPGWWLDKVREIAEDRKDTMSESLGELARLLSDAVGRQPPWEHSSVSRFLNENVTTVPMAEAFSILFGIPRPFYEPRSYAEALSMQQVAGKYAHTDGKITTPEQSRRLAEVDELLAKETQKARLDRDGHAADDDRQHGSRPEGGGRSRRVARRRPPPARS
jgi:hypothetical protein